MSKKKYIITSAITVSIIGLGGLLLLNKKTNDKIYELKTVEEDSYFTYTVEQSNKNTLFVLFNNECSHCQAFDEAVNEINIKDEFPEMDIVYINYLTPLGTNIIKTYDLTQTPTFFWVTTDMETKMLKDQELFNQFINKDTVKKIFEKINK